jgi:hypothetical protein
MRLKRAVVLRAVVLRAVAVGAVALCVASCATTQTTSPRSISVSSELAASGLPSSGPASSPAAGQVSGAPASTGSGEAASLVPSAVGGNPDPALEKRLWAVAVSAATSDGGTVKEAQAVLSTRTRAVNVTMGDGTEDDDQPVWVVQVEGVGEFVCDGCSYPQGAVAPRGRFQVLVVTVSTLRTLDFGLTDTKADLTQLGDVVGLHP